MTDGPPWALTLRTPIESVAVAPALLVAMETITRDTEASKQTFGRVSVRSAMRLLVLIMTAVLSAGLASAQENALPSLGELGLPPMTTPSETMPSDGTSLMSPEATSDTQLPEIRLGPAESAFDTCENCEAMSEQPYDLWDFRPVPIESTGTWLRRGLWYAEAEVVVMNRIWSRDQLILASQDGLPPLLSNFNRFLIIQAAHPGEDASVKTTLGRYLFRDIENRDHSLEFTTFVGGDWVQDTQLDSPNGQMRVLFAVAGNNRSFDLSTLQTVLYTNQYNSFELNYRLKQRMRRDQMVMDPNGFWTRRANHGFTFDYLVGIRYLEMSEVVDWRAFDIQGAGNDGRYFVQTDNDLIGLQLGAGCTYETSRWSIGINGIAGAYANDASAHSQLNFTVDDTGDFDYRLSEDELSFIGESSLVAKWHLTPNFSLRAGLHLLYVTSVAQAPHQLNFIGVPTKLVTSGDPYYQGVSLGFEGYW